MFLSTHIATNANNPAMIFQSSSINFLPYWLHCSVVAIWLGLILLGKRLNQDYLFVYRTHFHVQIMHLKILCTEADLLFITLFYPTLGPIGMLMFFLSPLVLAINLMKTRSSGLLNLMVDDIMVKNRNLE